MIIMTSTSVSISSYLLGLKLQNLMTNKSFLTDIYIFFYLEPYASGALAQSVLDGKRLVLTAAVATPIYLNHFLYQRQQASVGFLLQLSPLWSLFIPASSSNTRLLVFFFFPDTIERLEIFAHRQVTGLSCMRGSCGAQDDARLVRGLYSTS